MANQVLATTAIAVLLSKEYEQFLVKLAPRIRRLDGNVTQCLLQRMELELTKLHALASEKNNNRSRNNDDNADANNIYLPSSPLSATSVDHHKQQQDDETVHVSSSLSIPVLVLGHLMRALAISGRSKELESVFAKTAVLPILRPNLSVGRLDEGGSRGECAGLTKLLNDILEEIVQSYSPVLVAAESIFGGPLSHINMDGATGDNAIYGNMTQNCLEVDLLTEGVWVPLVSALMSDPGIKMSIFSPGIASILQANFMAFDSFVSSLASRLLSHCTTNGDESRLATSIVNYDTISTSQLRIQLAQDRIYAHPQTAAFAKKWNLPIYYQLRFGECCTRLNKAITQTKQEGWITNVFTGEESQSALLRQRVGFELSLFIELYDALLGLWRPDVILRPLTNRFLRGAVQIVGRVVSFINEGMEGKILFGDEPQNDEDGYSEKGTNAESESSPPGHPTRKPYCWGESEENIAAVAWELALLEVAIRNDYVALVTNALVPTSSNVDSNESEHDELQQLVVEFLNEASDSIHPTIEKAWNHCIVNLLTQKCSTPFAAVKGVAATYRMTNRPPPTQASPFVATILRPLKEFDAEFTNRIPVQIGSTWKHQIIVTLTDRYVAAVDDLIATVRRTEEALKNRKTRRTATGAMSDGEKVKLQLYLDYRAFVATIRDVGIDPASVIGVTKLSELTSEGEKLLQQTVNDN